MKRSAQVNVRLSPADMNLLRKAGKTLYPGLQVSNSTLVLTLARQRAQEILAERKKWAMNCPGCMPKTRTNPTSRYATDALDG
jgi:uncharacterized protein (DUF1778 family)